MHSRLIRRHSPCVNLFLYKRLIFCQLSHPLSVNFIDSGVAHIHRIIFPFCHQKYRRSCSHRNMGNLSVIGDSLIYIKDQFIYFVFQFHTVNPISRPSPIKKFRKLNFKPHRKCLDQSGAGDLTFGKTAHSITNYSKHNVAVVCGCLFD